MLVIHFIHPSIFCWISRLGAKGSRVVQTPTIFYTVYNLAVVDAVCCAPGSASCTCPEKYCDHGYIQTWNPAMWKLKLHSCWCVFHVCKIRCMWGGEMEKGGLICIMFIMLCTWVYFISLLHLKVVSQQHGNKRTIVLAQTTETEFDRHPSDSWWVWSSTLSWSISAQTARFSIV